MNTEPTLSLSHPSSHLFSFTLSLDLRSSFSPSSLRLHRLLSLPNEPGTPPVLCARVVSRRQRPGTEGGQIASPPDSSVGRLLMNIIRVILEVPLSTI